MLSSLLYFPFTLVHLTPFNIQILILYQEGQVGKTLYRISNTVCYQERKMIRNVFTFASEMEFVSKPWGIGYLFPGT